LVDGQLKNALQIRFVLRLEGASPTDLPGLVLVRAQSNLGPSASPRGGVGEGFRVLALPLEPSHYGRTHTVSIRVDPDNDVLESNEGNNEFRVSAFVPSQPGSTQRLSCSVS
jgi:hypothetical protein